MIHSNITAQYLELILLRVIHKNGLMSDMVSLNRVCANKWTISSTYCISVILHRSEYVQKLRKLPRYLIAQQERVPHNHFTQNFYRD